MRSLPNLAKIACIHLIYHNRLLCSIYRQAFIKLSLALVFIMPGASKKGVSSSSLVSLRAKRSNLSPRLFYSLESAARLCYHWHIADMEVNVLLDEDFTGCPDRAWLQNVVERVITAQGVGPGVELGLFITGQERVQQLNRSYRQKDEPTDVLAFTMNPPVSSNESPPFVMPPDGLLHLGEVIIAYPQAVIQAEEHQHSLKKELAILIIHGVLHLLGYDHEEPEPERQMRAREKEILSQIEID